MRIHDAADYQQIARQFGSAAVVDRDIVTMLVDRIPGHDWYLAVMRDAAGDHHLLEKIGSDCDNFTWTGPFKEGRNIEAIFDRLTQCHSQTGDEKYMAFADSLLAAANDVLLQRHLRSELAFMQDAGKPFTAEAAIDEHAPATETGPIWQMNRPPPTAPELDLDTGLDADMDLELEAEGPAMGM